MDTNIQKYAALIKTVECGSFTKAAELLHYSQSGISRMINDLEKEWGIILLERSKARVKLTSDGIKIIPFIKSIIEEYTKLQVAIDGLNGLQRGLIRIGAFSSIAANWLPNIIKDFQKIYPNIDYEIALGDTSQVEAWVLNGEVDCGFICLPARPEFELDTLFLEQDPLVAVFPYNNTSMFNKGKVTIASLCDEPFILLKNGDKSEAMELFKRCGVTPNVRLATSDDYVVMSMIENGLGVSILSQLILKRKPYRVITKELETPAYRNIGIAVRGKKTVSPSVNEFIKYLKHRYKSN